jgi:Zn-dependent peptidase ImmA (M78 family)/transcriptional regulator with XRE-family HTH domain
MHSNTIEVSVRPSVLQWLRESAGLGVADVARRLGTSEAAVQAWESGDRRPTLRTLEKLSVFLKRPLAAFLLPQRPSEPPLPTDFRSLPDKEKLPMGRTTRLAIREARRMQAVAGDRTAQLGSPLTARITKISLPANPETLAETERRRLGIGVHEQVRWASTHHAFSQWRRGVEQLGVLVFQLPMPVEEARGFSLTDGGLPAIVVNSSDAITARIFTLFHEYAHLLLDAAGVCLPHEGAEDDGRIEKFCNHFSGAFLVPKAALLADGRTKQIAQSAPAADANLEELAERFKVSEQVVWRRLQVCGLISTARYQAKLHRWEHQVRASRKKPSFGLSPARRCVAQRGRLFASTVLEAKERDLITYSDVSDFLSVRVKHLDSIQGLLREQQNG